MKKIKTNLIMSLSILLLGILPVFATDNPNISTPNVYPQFGLKYNFGLSDIGQGGHLHFFYAPNEDYIKLGFVAVSQISDGTLKSLEGLVASYEVLWGHFYQTGIITTSTAIGLSLNASNNLTKLGIPIEAEFTFVPFSFMGIGLSAYANFNTYKSFYIISLNYSLGKLREF